MPRRRASKKKRHIKEKIPIATAIGLFATLLGRGVAESVRSGDFKGAFNQLTKNLTGYDMDSGSWSSEDLIAGITPLLAGAAVSWGASKFKLNQRIRTIGLPVKL